jgi:hypothetical protein
MRFVFLLHGNDRILHSCPGDPFPLPAAQPPSSVRWALLQAHRGTGAVVVGTDTGRCVLYDARTAQEEWFVNTGSQINAVAIVPAPDVRSLVIGHDDGTLRLLDLRRQSAAAELAHVWSVCRVSSLVTDGCCALAGSDSGGVVVWNLDPASTQTARDSARGIMCSGAGMAFCEQLERGGQGETTSVAMTVGPRGLWCLAAAHMGGSLDLCVLAD